MQGQSRKAGPLQSYSPRHAVHAPLWLHRLRARWALALAPVVLLLSPGFGLPQGEPAAAASGRAADSAGAMALGSAAYSIPAGAVFVSRQGQRRQQRHALEAGPDLRQGAQRRAQRRHHRRPVRVLPRAVIVA